MTIRSKTPQRRRGLLLLAAALALSSQTLRMHGQADSGRVVGSVTDSSGAAIPQASITLRNRTTGVKLTGTSRGCYGLVTIGGSLLPFVWLSAWRDGQGREGLPV